MAGLQHAAEDFLALLGNRHADGQGVYLSATPLIWRLLLVTLAQLRIVTRGQGLRN